MAASYEQSSDDETRAAAAARVAAIPKWTADQRSALRGSIDLLATHGFQEQADLLKSRLSVRPAAEVVVVGEAKRGKSSVVNSLLRVAHPAPVGVDITTGVFIRFRCVGSDEPADPPVVLMSDGGSRVVDEAELSDWVTVGGRYVNPEDGPIPVGAEVTVPGALLEDVILVDTPGVGGLVGGHSRLAMRAAHSACALLFVTDAGQPLTEPECRFLVEAAEQVETVIFVVSKVDKHPGADEILAENRELLRRHAPRFADAPIVGVSSQLAMMMRDRPAEQAAALAQASGYDRLVDELRSRLQDSGDLHTANVLRTAHSALGQLAVSLRRELDAVAQDPEVLAGLEADRAHFAELAEQEGQWIHYFERDLRNARSRAVAKLGARADALKTSWRHRLQTEKGAYRKGVADAVAAELRGDLLAMTDEVVTEFLTDLTGVVGKLGQEAVIDDLPGLVTRSASGGTDAPSGLQNALDPSLISTGFVGYSMAGAGTAAVFGGAVATTAVIAAPVAFLAAVILHRQLQSGRRRLSEFASEEITRARTDIVAHIDDTITHIKPDVVVAVRGGLRRRLTELKRVIEEANKAASLSRRERESRMSKLRTHLAAVDAQRAELDPLLAG